MFGLGQEVLGNGINGQAINSLQDWDNFAKAVQVSSYQTDHDGMTGVAAIRKESLEPTLRAVVAQSDTFTFFKGLKRQPVTSAVHEWMVQLSRGGQVDGMNIGELGEIQFDVGDYRRKVERLKLFATGAKISDFANVQSLEGESLRARENENAMVRIANAVERSLFVSDERYSPNKVNGFKAQVRNFEGGRNIINLNGSSDVDDLVQTIFHIKADVRQEGNYGDVTDTYVDAATQNALDQKLMPQYRVQLDNNPTSLQYGAPVGAIKTSYGNLKLNHTIWNDSAANTQPTIVKNRGRVPDKVPGQPTVTVTPVASAPGSADGWTAERAGEYWYAVSLVDADGREGLPSVLQSGTVAEGGALRVSGNAAFSAVTATGGRIYRSRKDRDTMPELKDLRLSGEFAVESDGSFEYVDVNQRIPGSSSVPVMNLKPDSIQWLQLRPAMQFPLFATNQLIHPWAVALYGTLQLGQPQHHYLIDGFVPESSPWQPFK
ncbi:phage capsid protein [Deinococcus sp. 23YEL01]|uniref:phage capsid protein n=1 Tax=Deinococcus sp. 23YEL01 TaxID=2745871 RepID=UPI001E49A41C|nr:phage capsid protein [Deinococcus sp. 23YEL01]MCD0168061.1 phage capsid protein [Deinococcus sp. 23YEL01]